MKIVLTASLLALAASARAGVAMGPAPVHPFVALLQNSAALRTEIRATTDALAIQGTRTLDLTNSPANQQFAAILAAHREQMPAGALSEVLGTPTDKKLASLKLDLEQLEFIKQHFAPEGETLEAITNALTMYYAADPDFAPVRRRR